MRTCTGMIYTDGKTATYAVMRGPMAGRAFNARAAEIVARYELGPGETADYRAMTAAHATLDAPAVYWQAYTRESDQRDLRARKRSRVLARLAK